MQVNFLRMKKLLLRFPVVLFFACLFQSVSAQQVDSVMAIYDEQFPKEKIHIHFDKSTYNKEETIWYKIYLLTADGMSALSKNVYVEWYDTTGRMLKQTVAPLFQSSAKGSFELPEEYKGSFIHVKAYTRWMLNDDTTFIYGRDLLINSDALPVKKPVVVPKTKLELFPEGGFLVQGLTSRLAFKATNQFGSPVYIKAFLVNSKNKTLDTLQVQHDGMGSLLFNPQAGETYKINWTDENGKTGSTPVEVTKTQGAVMSVTTNNEKAMVRVERTAGVTENFKQFTLLVHMNQKLFFKAELKGADRLVQQAAIPIEELPTGIFQFTLFTNDWIPVSERIIFINNHTHEFNAKLLDQQISLEKRGKNVIDIQVSDTAMANMSISITDANVPIPEANTIFSDMLLSSELRGKVYNPAYYLKSDADTVTAHLDLLMLTNGWRRLDWEKIKTGVLPTNTYPVETDLMKIGGKVFGMKSVSAASPLMINAIVVGKDSSKRLMFLPIEKDGSFEDKSIFFYDTVRIYYGFNGATKFTDAQVKFENGLLRQQAKSTRYGARDPWTIWTDSMAKTRMNLFLTQQEQLKRMMAATTLQEVTVRARAKKETNLQALDKRYASGLFTGGDGYSFDLTEDPFAKSALNVLSYLQGKVAGLNIAGSGMQATLSWRGGTPALFLNEMQSTTDMIQTINVGDIAYIKVFRPPFFGASGGGSGGAIAVYTKKGGDASKSGPGDGKGLENALLGGYSLFKEFYSPMYEKPNENPDADVRTTLYWNPYILTNMKNPRYRIQFYNNDISKQLKVVLEGINSEGKMMRVVKMLE